MEEKLEKKIRELTQKSNDSSRDGFGMREKLKSPFEHLVYACDWAIMSLRELEKKGVENTEDAYELYNASIRSILEKMEETGMVGHPPYCAWFCGAHYDKARDLSDKTIDVAFKILKE